MIQPQPLTVATLLRTSDIWSSLQKGRNWQYPHEPTSSLTWRELNCFWGLALSTARHPNLFRVPIVPSLFRFQWICEDVCPSLARELPAKQYIGKSIGDIHNTNILGLPGITTVPFTLHPKRSKPWCWKPTNWYIAIAGRSHSDDLMFVEENSMRVWIRLEGTPKNTPHFMPWGVFQIDP